MSDTILAEFDAKAELYGRVTLKAASLIMELLTEYQISFHSVTSRTKDRRSLAKKLSKQGRAYGAIGEITDISGVRIVTYFEADVDRVVSVLKNEFQIDERNSIDKRLMFDPDRFGYLSTHHVVTLSEARAGLQEYRWFEDNCIEIQTRSILQHAWAEIEHDLGYKSKHEVPKHIRRKFSRLAGLLELADSEFNAIRTELSEYDIDVVGKIQEAPNSIEINKSSLLAFVSTNKSVHELDAFIATIEEWDLVTDERYLAEYTSNLEFVGVQTIGELESALSTNLALVYKFASRWLEDDAFDEDDRDSTIHRGISIFYVILILLAIGGDEVRIIEYFSTFSIGAPNEHALATKVLAIYAELS